MRTGILKINKRFMSTPVFNKRTIYSNDSSQLKNEDKPKKKVEKDTKIKYSKPSYEHMYANLPIKCYLD